MLFLGSKKFPCLCIPLKNAPIRKSKYLIQLPILVAGFPFFFKKKKKQTVSYFTEYIRCFFFRFYEVMNLYNLLAKYIIHSCSNIKIRKSDLFWEFR